MNHDGEWECWFGCCAFWLFVGLVFLRPPRDGRASSLFGVFAFWRLLALALWLFGFLAFGLFRLTQGKTRGFRRNARRILGFGAGQAVILCCSVFTPPRPASCSACSPSE
eukprot:scaffold1550_cov245-Pinguiococcus_pyrenoidosus.AAC.1